MKRKSQDQETAPVVKTSVSIPEVLMKFANERIAKEGYNSFSAYLAHLVREHRKEYYTRLGLKVPGDYPDHIEEQMRVEELGKPSSPKNPGSATEFVKKEGDQAIRQAKKAPHKTPP